MLRIGAAAISAVALAAISVPSNAAYKITFEQVGDNVIASGSGSLDLTGLTGSQPAIQMPLVNSAAAGAIIGAWETVTIYNGASGPASFGENISANMLTFAEYGRYGDSSLGSPVGIFGQYGAIFVPFRYVSGTDLGVSTATFARKTLADLRLSTGLYSYTWASDRLDVEVVGLNSAVPEPATWAMMLVGFGGIGFAMRRRKSKVTTTVAYA